MFHSFLVRTIVVLKRGLGGEGGGESTKPYIRLETSPQSLLSNNIKAVLKPVSIKYVCKHFIRGKKSLL
jgi:hypothetical protein